MKSKAASSYWLIKSEPDVYPYSQLEKDGRTAWTGVRNFEARNNLRAMKPGEWCLYYHSVNEKALVGVARVLATATSDPTAPGEDWASVEVGPHLALKVPVTLAQVKADAQLEDFILITRSRLSVAKVEPRHFRRVLQLSKTKL